MKREPILAGHSFIPRGEGLSDDLWLAYHGSGRKIRIRIVGFRDGVKQLIQQYRIPACKRCRMPKSRHHHTCKFQEPAHAKR